MPFTSPNYYGTIGANFLGGNPAAFFTDPNFRIDLGGMSTTTPTAGAPGNLNGMQQALQFFSNPAIQGLSESVQQQLAANPSVFGGNQNSSNIFNVDPEEFNPFLINRSQFFIKFQYLIGV